LLLACVLSDALILVRSLSIRASVMLLRLLFAIMILMVEAGPSTAQNLDESLLAYAVNVHRTPVQSWPGYGIYLGNGLFITAAHVVGRAWLTRPKVVIAGQDYSTSVVKEGSFEGTDLTLLAVEERLLPLRLSLRRNTLCKERPWPGEQVVTVVPEGIARSHIIAPDRLPIGVRKFSTVIADVANTGNSGSGVFDAQHRCLLGIMSRKISQSRTRRDTGKTETRDIAKYFVPSSEIAAFLPADLAKQNQ
jgi:hypothetical protein